LTSLRDSALLCTRTHFYSSFETDDDDPFVFILLLFTHNTHSMFAQNAAPVSWTAKVLSALASGKVFVFRYLRMDALPR
jgi:hypothetical protein